jgi:hypothetical protein
VPGTDREGYFCPDRYVARAVGDLGAVETIKAPVARPDLAEAHLLVEALDPPYLRARYYRSLSQLSPP